MIVSVLPGPSLIAYAVLKRSPHPVPKRTVGRRHHYIAAITQLQTHLPLGGHRRRSIPLINQRNRIVILMQLHLPGKHIATLVARRLKLEHVHPSAARRVGWRTPPSVVMTPTIAAIEGRKTPYASHVHTRWERREVHVLERTE